VPEGADEAGAFAADATKGMSSPAGQLPEIASTQVRQLVLFPVAPEVFDGIEFWGIRRKSFHPDFTMQTFQVRPHQLAAVGGYAVPDDEQLASDMSLEVF